MRDNILVHQMGKVGSTTVFSTLQNSFPRKKIFHTHSIAPKSLAVGLASLQRMGCSSVDIEFKRTTLNQIKESRELYDLVSNRSCVIVSAVRNPFDHTISCIFQEAGLLLPELAQEDITDEEKLWIIEKRINSSFTKIILDKTQPATAVHYMMRTFFTRHFSWWNEEFLPMYGVDMLREDSISQYTDSCADDYWTFQCGMHDFFVYRFERINKILPALVDYIEPSATCVKVNSNLTSTKSWGGIYRKFLRTYIPPKEMQMYYKENAYTKMFYPEIFPEMS